MGRKKRNHAGESMLASGLPASTRSTEAGEKGPPAEAAPGAPAAPAAAPAGPGAIASPVAANAAEGAGARADARLDADTSADDDAGAGEAEAAEARAAAARATQRNGDSSGLPPGPGGPHGPGGPGDRGWLASLGLPAVAAMVILGCLALYLPYSGSYGLHDPWETHYGEVAREMVYGHELSGGHPDWVRPHWEHEWFKSKPVLNFWLMGLAMKATGLGSGDDGELVMQSRTEWILRFPFILFGVAGVFAVWLACSRLINRRTGLIAAAVLATCPQYFFVSRQAMTDMPFVGLVNLAMCFFMLAYFGADDEREVWKWRISRGPGKPPLEISAVHIFWAVLLLITVPQYLLFGTFRFMRTAVRLGGSRIALGGWPHVLPYASLIGVFIYLTWNTRRMRDVWLYACYLAIGVSMLGKGVGGLVLPVGCIACYLVLTGEWRKVFQWREFRVHLQGALLVTVPVSFPWYHAMVATLGAEFWNEMFGHHHWKRLAVGVHGDTGTFDYYLMQLGVGMFPWAGLVPVALARFTRPQARADRSPEERARLFVMCWFLVSFTLFTLMITKFHHYILPAVPPLAILVAIYLDEVIEAKVGHAKAVGLLLSLGFYAFIARDLATEQQRLLWLFCYNYAREWPKQFDYEKVLTFFAVVGALPILALAVAAARRATPQVRALCVGALGLIAVCFTYFALDKYLVEISPHWTQKEVLKEYYKMRNPEKPEALIAWQMNWRGETFYTKNKVQGFVDKHQKLKDYIKEHAGERTFFMFEKSRYSAFKAMLPNPKSREELQLLGKEKNNKFYLAVTTL